MSAIRREAVERFWDKYPEQHLRQYGSAFARDPKSRLRLTNGSGRSCLAKAGLPLRPLVMRRLISSLMVALLVGCANTSPPTADAGSPAAIVKRLLPYPNSNGNTPKFTTREELPAIKSYLTPELYSQLWDWAVWCQKAIDAIPEVNSLRMNYQLAPSYNIFIDGKAIDATAPVTQAIKDHSATVTVKDVYREKGSGPVVSRTTSVFSLVRQNGAWVVSDVNLSRIDYQPRGTFNYTLSERLARNIADFKKKASR